MNTPNPAPTPRTDGDERQYPLPEHAQRIVFEGCDSVVVSPEAYEALYEHARTLERELTSAQAALAAKDAEIEDCRQILHLNAGELDDLAKIAQQQKTRAEKAEAELAEKDREVSALNSGLIEAEETVAQLRAAPTPRTDDVAAKIDALACQWRTGQIDAVQYEEATRLEMDRLRTLERELTSAQAALAAKDAEIAEERERSATHEYFKDNAYKLVDAWRTRAEKAEAELADLRHQHASVFRMLGIPENDFGELENFFIRAADTRAERDQLRAEVERLKVAQRERTQWKCACGGTDCDGQEENKLLRTEVERLKDFELNYETLTRLLHNRFKMKDGVMPDYKVEDVLVENIQLRAALAAAKVDTERLDWLENQGQLITRQYRDGWHFDASNGAWVCVNATTLRAAIDAARGAKP